MRKIVTIDNVLRVLEQNSEHPYSVREVIRELGFGDSRSVSAYLHALVSIGKVKQNRILGYAVYIAPKLKKR